MPDTKKIKSIKPKSQFNPKILIWFAIVLAFFLGVVLLVEGSIDTGKYRARAIAAVEQATGKKMAVRGAVTITLLPIPTVYFPAVELRDEENAVPTPSFTAEMITASVAPLSVFSGQPIITSIALQRPVLEVTRAEDNIVHWDWLTPKLARDIVAGGSQAISVDIIDGKLLYHDEKADSDIAIESLNASISGGTNFNAQGTFYLYGHDLHFAVDTKPGNAPAPDGAKPLHIALSSSDKSAVKLDGALFWTEDAPRIQGNIDLDLPDIQTWLKAKSDKKQKLIETVTNEFTHKEEDKTQFPLKLKGAWDQNGIDIKLQDATLEGVNSAGSGVLSLSWKDWQPAFGLDMNFSALDYSLWRQLVQRAFASATATKNDSSRLFDTNDQPENPLPKNLQVDVKIISDKLYVGSQTWNKAHITAGLADQAVTVNQFDIELPGGANLSLFGIISQGSTSGLRFEGGMETSGQSLRETLTVLDESARDLPDTGFGQYYIRSNIFVSAQQMRLSEADVKISDLRLNGGLVAYFDQRPRIEADVKLKDINFDYFRNVWREREKAAGHQDFFLKFDKSLNFNWLKKLQTTIDLKINVEQFTFLERKGDAASFRIFAREGEFGIYDIRFYYPTDTTEASFMLDVHGAQPFVNVTLNTNELNTNYFSVEESKEAPLVLPPPPPEMPGMFGVEKPAGAPESPSPGNSSSAPDAGAASSPQAPAVSPAVAGSAVPSAPAAQSAPVPSAPAPTTGSPASIPAPVAAPLPQNAFPAAPVSPYQPVGSVPVPAAQPSAAIPPPQPYQPVNPPPAAVGAVPPVPVNNAPAAASSSGSGPASSSYSSPGLEITPQVEKILIAANDENLPTAPKAAESIEDIKRSLTNKPSEIKDSKRWPENLIDMSWMEGFRGSFDLSIGRLIHKDKVVDRVKLQAKLENNLLTFQTLTFIYWQARCSVLGSMYGGKVPGLSISFTLFNVELSDMLRSLAGRTNVSGKASVSGTLSTSGVNLLSWVSQSDAKLVMNGVGVNVSGLNLQGVVDAVNVSRTAADVFNNVNRALVSGNTTFSIEGNINVKNGVMKTPGITLKADTILGNLNGEVRLVPWTMDLNTQFQFPAMTSETIPTMTVQLSGELNDAQLKTDTSSLEAFVVKRITGK